MSKNSFFKYNRNEQSLIDQLTIETIKIHGEDMVYIPRTFVDIDEIFGEDSLSHFDEGNLIEMYIETPEGFEGEGDFIAKFGLEIRDTVNLVVSRTRFEQVMSHNTEIKRPREGDLVFFPLSRSLFEIKFVEHENPFYQSGSLYTYKLSCELFKYSHEDLNTGFSDVDGIEDKKSNTETILTLGDRLSSSADFIRGETVFQIYGATGGVSSDADVTAIVTDWDLSTKTLRIVVASGDISQGTSTDSIKGLESGTEYTIASATGSTDIIPLHDSDSIQGDNDDFQREADRDNLIDFSDADPFSEGGNW